MKSSKKTVFLLCVHCIAALLLGAGIYLLLRPNSVIGKVIAGIIPVPRVNFPKSWWITLASNHLADALWAYALTFALSCVWRTRAAACTAFLFGVAWELLQKTGVMQGYFDPLDVLSYLAASLLAVWIIKTIKKEKNT